MKFDFPVFALIPSRRFIVLPGFPFLTEYKVIKNILTRIADYHAPMRSKCRDQDSSGEMDSFDVSLNNESVNRDELNLRQLIGG